MHAVDMERKTEGVLAEAQSAQNERRVRHEFEALAFPVQRDLYAFAYRLTGRREDAEDLAQDVLVRAYRSFHRFESGSNFKAWIYKIATNLYINAYRRRDHCPDPVMYEEMGGVERLGIHDARADQHPESSLMASETAKALWSAVQGIKEPFRATLILCDVEDLTYEETAEAMGAPIGTVRSRLFRARRMVRDLLSGEDGVSR